MVPSFRTIWSSSEELNERMHAQLRELLALELGAQSLSDLDDDELLTLERFAPMKRLLRTNDDAFLRAQGHPQQARRTNRDHRMAYKGYLKELSYQVRSQRALRKLAMSGSRKWDLRTDLQRTLACESALLHLRWLGWKRWLGISVDAAAIENCLAVLVPEFRPISQAT